VSEHDVRCMRGGSGYVRLRLRAGLRAVSGSVAPCHLPPWGVGGGPAGERRGPPPCTVYPWVRATEFRFVSRL